MIVTILFAVTGLLYAAACTSFLALLARGTASLGVWGVRLLAGAVVAHVGFLLADWLAAGHVPTGDIHETLAISSLLMSLSFVAVARRPKMRVLGAFVTPLTLLFFLAAALGRSVGHVPPNVRSAILPVHVGANLLGIVVFGIAFAVAIAYLIQERLLRRKQIGGLFQRLPALDALDTLGLRLVVIGFPLLTLGIVTGTVWAIRLGPESPMFSTAQGFALLAWVLFAGVLLLRVAAGWRGRRAAIGTMLGFICAMAVLVGYIVRASNGAIQ